MIILGISPGTRSFGFAVIKNGDLTDWRIRAYKGVWSEQKRQYIILTLTKLIEQQKVNTIALKLVHPSRSSAWLKELQLCIQTLAVQKGIKADLFYIEDIKRLCNDRANKDCIAKYMVELYPHLSKEYARQMGSRNSYYLKMFEAIAVAGLVH